MGEGAPACRASGCGKSLHLSMVNTTRCQFKDPILRRRWISCAWSVFLAGVVTTTALTIVTIAQEGTGRTLTPRQFEIQKQSERLNSPDVEERREALIHLKALRDPEASRAAISGLKDGSAIVRATASSAVLMLPGQEAATSLLPLLEDKDEFVRQEAAYALGQTRSRMVVGPLIEKLARDKKDGVRGAAAVALGHIGDDAAVVPLAQILSPQSGLPDQKKIKRKSKEKNEFVLRAAARSLGQIGSRAGVPALVAALEDEKAPDDVRREAALALGQIGDPSARNALQGVLSASDPYLSFAAAKALRRISAP